MTTETNGYPYIMQGDNIVVMVNNTPKVINKNTIGYDEVKAAILNGEWEKVNEFINPKAVLINYGSKNITIKGDKFFWKDNEMHNALTRRFIQMYQQKQAIKPLARFIDNLMENPSNRSVTQLYGFLENNSLPITDDGHFIAYKKVNDDYTDCYTGKINNSVGEVPVMDRNMVDDDPTRTCSHGLHVCSREYLNNFGGSRTMIVKVHPRDVVSVPHDYKFSKMRCCRYEVIGEMGVEQSPDDYEETVVYNPEA